MKFRFFTFDFGHFYLEWKPGLIDLFKLYKIDHVCMVISMVLFLINRSKRCVVFFEHMSN